MEYTLHAIAQRLNGRLIGDGAVPIRGVRSVDQVQPGELTFADSPKHLAMALKSPAAAVIVAADVQELPGRPGISVKNPRLAFAQVLELFHPYERASGAVHPSAVVAKDAQVGPEVDIRANAVIGERARIGRGTIIEAGVFVGHDVSIGDDCFIGPNVAIYRGTQIGHRVRIHGGSVIGGDGFGYVFHEGRHVKIPQVGNVIIENDVELGCNVCVDRATVGSTVIREGTKIDNLVQIAHNDQIGRHVIMSGQVGLSGSVTVGDYTMMGGKAGIVDHVTVGAQARIGAASVVTKDVAPRQAVWGFPAREQEQTIGQMAALSRLPSLWHRLVQVVKRWPEIEKRLDQLEAQEGRRPKKPSTP